MIITKDTCKRYSLSTLKLLRDAMETRHGDIGLTSNEERQLHIIYREIAIRTAQGGIPR